MLGAPELALPVTEDDLLAADCAVAEGVNCSKLILSAAEALHAQASNAAIMVGRNTKLVLEVRVIFVYP
jgi:hypothetical protein